MKKNIYIVISVLVGCAIGYSLASLKSGPNVAYAQPAPTPMMCSNGGGIPNGYVVVNTSDTNQCIGPDGTHGSMYQLLKPKPLPSGGTSASICTGTPVPSGFVTFSWSQNANVCRASGSPTNNVQNIALYN
jgi:hypothetical protein